MRILSDIFFFSKRLVTINIAITYDNADAFWVCFLSTCCSKEDMI